MAKLIKMYYSSNRNITFQNENCPDVWKAPDDWDEMSKEAQEEYLNDEREAYIWDLVDVYAEVVDDDDTES